MLGRRSFREIFWLRLLLCGRGFGAEKENRGESQSPGAVTHSAIVARAPLWTRWRKQDYKSEAH